MILKRKTRYILVRSSRELDLSDKALWSSLRQELSRFMGEKPYLEANPFLAEQIDKRSFVVRVIRGSERQVALAFAFAKELNGEIGFATLRISGTIKALKTKQGLAYKKPRR